MKKNSYIFLCIIYLTTSINLYSQKDTCSCLLNSITMMNTLKQEHHKSILKILFSSLLASITVYSHRKNIIQIMSNYPISSFAIFYLIGNYIIDNIANYGKIKHSLKILRQSYILNYYLLTIHAIKNNLSETYKNNTNEFDQQYIINTIQQITGYSIEELELLMTEFMQPSLYGKQYETSIPLLHDRLDSIYVLLKNKITIQQIASASCHNHIFKKALKDFLHDPKIEYKNFIQTIGILIKQQLDILLGKNLHILS